MNGTETARKASRSAMLVCVNAPGLMITKSIPSRLVGLHLADQFVLGVALRGDQLMTRPGPALVACLRSAASVTVRRSPGSRLPSRFKLGPLSNRIRAIVGVSPAVP